MTEKQYALIQRCIGKLEGIGASLSSEAALYYYDTLDTLEKTIEEIHGGTE